MVKILVDHLNIAFIFLKVQFVHQMLIFILKLSNNEILSGYMIRRTKLVYYVLQEFCPNMYLSLF